MVLNSEMLYGFNTKYDAPEFIISRSRTVLWNDEYTINTGTFVLSRVMLLITPIASSLVINEYHQYLKEKNKDLKIEIEVRNFDELQEAMRVGGIDRIMLDNFNIENTKKAVEMVAGRYELESSGGITFATLRDYAECGVDYISVGALTHSVKGLDMSFKAC